MIQDTVSARVFSGDGELSHGISKQPVDLQNVHKLSQGRLLLAGRFKFLTGAANKHTSSRVASLSLSLSLFSFDPLLSFCVLAARAVHFFLPMSASFARHRLKKEFTPRSNPSDITI